MLAFGMCFNEADVQRSSAFVLCSPKRWFKKKRERRRSRLDCGVTYVSHLTWCKAQLRLNRVSIDPSELYHIMQSCCLLHSACVRAHLLSVTGCFASAASFGFCLHASMHSHCLDIGTDSLWMCAQQPKRVLVFILSRLFMSCSV